jgi:RNA methyltransferase, TrmH family
MLTPARSVAPERARARDALELVRALRARPERDRLGLHYAEGVRAVLHAVEAGIGVHTLVHSEVLLREANARRLVRDLRRQGVRTASLTPEEFRGVSCAAHASGVGAVLRQHWTPLDRADPRAGLCWVALRRLRSPGNFGTILRTIEACGAAGVLLLGDSADPFDPAVVRASMAGVFHVRLVRTTFADFTAWARSRGCTVLGASPDGPCDYSEAPLARPLVVLIGEEREGLASHERAACTRTVRIPLAGCADSLNVAVAAGIMLYEVRRRLGALSDQPTRPERCLP